MNYLIPMKCLSHKNNEKSRFLACIIKNTGVSSRKLKSAFETFVKMNRARTRKYVHTV
jgi:hypothetical protein